MIPDDLDDLRMGLTGNKIRMLWLFFVNFNRVSVVLLIVLLFYFRGIIFGLGGIYFYVSFLGKCRGRSVKFRLREFDGVDLNCNYN